MLNQKQARFAAEYLVDLNATHAAIRAGYSKRSAHAQGHDLLKHPEVAAEIGRLTSVRKLETLSSVQATHDEIRAIAHSDVRALLNEDGRVKPVSEWPDEVARAVAAIEITETWKPGETKEDEPYLVVVTKLKLWDKTTGLTLKGRTQKLFVDTLEVKLDQSTADRLAAARERLKTIDRPGDDDVRTTAEASSESDG